MRSTRLVVAASAVVVAAAGGAAATPVPPPPVRVDLCAVPRSGPEPSRADDSGATARPARKYEPVELPGSSPHGGTGVTLAGDLNRDGVQDVVHVRTREVADPAGIRTEVVVGARRGQDGRPLWTATPPVGPIGWFPAPQVYGAKVGADGRDGVVLVAVRRAVAGSVAVVVWAYGGDGVLLWQYEAPSTVTGSGFLQPADAAPGRAADLVVESLDRIGTAPATVEVLQPKVVNGATGKVVDVGPPVVSQPGGSLRLSAIADVTGDGLHDLVVVERMADGTGCMSLRGGVDGRIRWATSVGPVEAGTSAWSLEDVTGDGAAELALPSLLRVWNGATGRLLWDRRAASRFAEILGVLGNVDRRAGGEVAAAEWFATGGVARTRIEAVTGAGRSVWRRELRFRPPAGWDPGEPWFTVLDAGDLQGDGVRDRLYVLSRANDRPVPPGHDGWLDGRTGATHRISIQGVWPLRAAVDGRHADLATAKVVRRVLTVASYDGGSGRVLWSTSLRVRENFTPGGSTAARFDRDRCADVLVPVMDDLGTSFVAFDGATGLPKWSLRSGIEGGEPGLEVAPKPDSHVDHNTCR